MNRRGRHRAPEVVQTSALDCGPAALTALLRGLGVPASYEVLRDVCATDVDGTSIDALEAVAVAAGVGASQMVVPVENVLALPEEYLPAIAVTLLPDGFTHFVVLWVSDGRRVTVMDPAVGRRRVPVDALRDELYRHRIDVPAQAWREWAGSDVFTEALRRRAAAVGIGASELDPLLASAMDDPLPRGLAVLDAALRAEEQASAGRARGRAVHRSRGRRAARPAERLATHLADGGVALEDRLWSCATPTDDGPGPDGVAVHDDAAPDSGAVPDGAAVPDGDEVEPTVELRGAVVVSAKGWSPADADAVLLERLSVPDLGPWQALWQAASSASRRPAAVLAGLGVVALAVASAAVAEVVVLRPFLDDGGGGSRWGRAVAVVAASTVVLASLIALSLRVGRRVEAEVRRSWWDAVTRLPTAFARSRPASDLAERGHVIHRLRELPGRAARAITAVALAVVGGIVLVIAAPDAIAAVPMLVAVSIGVPLAARRRLVEADLRAQTLAGCLTRPNVDALLGSQVADQPTVAAALVHEHEGLLGTWRAAMTAKLRAAAVVQAVGGVLAAGVLAWAVVAVGPADPAKALLAVVLGLLVIDAGAAVAEALHTLPTARSTAARVAGPLQAASQAPGVPGPDGSASGLPDPSPERRSSVGTGLHFEGVSVAAGVTDVLDHVDLAVPVGAHVAVVGVSGAGKSTLLSVALGLTEPTDGTVQRSAPAAGAAWAAPGVRLWDATVADNVSYGSSPGAEPVAERLAAAGVDQRVVAIDRAVGDAGRTLSDGEAQRVRLARALGRPDADLVVLDEAFRGLDRTARRELLALAREQWNGSTVLCALHEIDDALGFDLAVVVDHGTVVQVGVPSALAADPRSQLARLRTAAAMHLDGWQVVQLDQGAT